MEEPWRPLFDRDSGDEGQFDVLHEGVPQWLDQSLWRWLMDRGAEGGFDLIPRLERRLRRPLAESSDRAVGTSHTAPTALLDRHWNGGDGQLRLTLLDALLADIYTRANRAAEDDDAETVQELVAAAESLGVLLAEGGSAWRVHVAPPYWSLVRRVGATTIERVEQVTGSDTDAARKIRSAWHACYRHSPDPDMAYRQAVLAVESMVIPVTVPDSPRASLGTAAAHVNDTLNRWSVGGLDSERIASGQVLYDMLAMLWHNQERHAHQDGAIVDVSQREAEVAVSTAVTLVHWFASGLVVKSKGDSDSG